MDSCSMCGSSVPEGQDGLCSMCYGDVGYGEDGYYEEFMREMDGTEPLDEEADDG